MHIVGGAYEERCMRPSWHEILGSGGRAVSAIAAFTGPGVVQLHCYVDERTKEVVEGRCILEGAQLTATDVQRTCRFRYVHGLDRPVVDAPANTYAAIEIRADHVLRFGMLEGDAIVHGDRVVYDPQNGTSPQPFRRNGSSAKSLAVVLNAREATAMTQLEGAPVEELAEAVAKLNGAQVVVIKRGPLGAFVFDGNEFATVPAFATSRVWKLGSGDVFSAHLALRWAHEGLKAVESAMLASKATALYCETSSVPLPTSMENFDKRAIIASSRYLGGYRPRVYLAGPFFTLAQNWLIEQARTNLQSFGLDVFSPYHDVGHGSADDVVGLDLDGIRRADLVFAIGDGLDSGTIFEIGYARALGKPVVVYSENESAENQKMMVGSDCAMTEDYVSAIYQTLWAAMAL